MDENHPLKRWTYCGVNWANRVVNTLRDDLKIGTSRGDQIRPL